MAGGIFLSTGLLHIIPEALERYKVYEDLKNAAAAGAGTVAASTGHAGHGHDHTGHGHAALLSLVNASTTPVVNDAVHGGGHGHAHEISFPVVFTIVLAAFYLMLMLEHLLIATCQRKDIDMEDMDYRDDVSFDPDLSETSDLEVFGHPSRNLASAIGSATGADREREIAMGNMNMNMGIGARRSSIEDDEREELISSGNGYQSRAFIAALIITMGVAAHSILESIALGAANKFSDVLNLFIAIAAHRWATAAALGIRYARAGLAAGPVVLLVFVFSFIAPIGVGFGFLAVGDQHTMAQSILFSMAAGTFLFLGASATLVVDESSSQLKMYIASAIGAVLMLIITAILVVKKVH